MRLFQRNKKRHEINPVDFVGYKKEPFKNTFNNDPLSKEEIKRRQAIALATDPTLYRRHGSRGYGSRRTRRSNKRSNRRYGSKRTRRTRRSNRR